MAKRPAKRTPVSRSKRTILPDARVLPRFSGISTFCRFPRLEDVQAENAPVDWAIYGAPFDSGVTFRPGARFGPAAVRDASRYIKRYSIAHDVDICDALSIADAGDAPVPGYGVKPALDAITAWTLRLGDPRSTKLLAVGGDHSIAYANIKATAERLRLGRSRTGSGLALLHFDSHLDTVDSVWGERFGHASPFRRLIEEGFVDPRRMLSVGIKGPLNSAADLEFAREQGVTVLTYDQWHASVRDGDDEIAAFTKRLGGAPAYISFDVDVVDPAFAPGTGTPVIGGFTSAEAIGLIRRAAGINLVGADVVEVLPDRDVSQITALLASHVIFEILCLAALARA